MYKFYVKWEYILIKVLIIVTFISCKASRISKSEEYANLNNEKLVEIIEDNEFNFESLNVKKISGNFKDTEKNFSFKGSLRIRKDSLILVSVSNIAGIESFRIFCSPDTLKFIDRVNSRYYTGNYGYLKNILRFKIDYFIIQSILTDSYLDFFKRKEKKIGSKDKKNFEEGYYNFGINDKNETGKYKDEIQGMLKISKILMHPENYKVNMVCIGDKNSKKEIIIGYDNYFELGEQFFPKSISIKYQNSDNWMQIDLRLSKIEMNKKIKFPFRISPKYKRIN